MTNREELISDISAASSAYVVNLLPWICKLGAAEQFNKLAAHFEAALLAYKDGLKGWSEIEPSRN